MESTTNMPTVSPAAPAAPAGTRRRLLQTAGALLAGLLCQSRLFAKAPTPAGVPAVPDAKPVEFSYSSSLMATDAWTRGIVTTTTYDSQGRIIKYCSSHAPGRAIEYHY